MAGRNSRVLADEFKRLTGALRQETLATTSFPLSYEIVCFPEISESACVLTRADIVGSRGDFVCTRSQAKELEAAYAHSFSPDSRDNSAAHAALMQRLEAMRETLTEQLSQAECDRL